MLAAGVPVVVHPSLPVNSLAELIAHAKASPSR
jgi:tripartite-type tricarboxylate transporter receptor subunit TctC